MAPNQSQGKQGQPPRGRGGGGRGRGRGAAGRGSRSGRSGRGGRGSVGTDAADGIEVNDTNAKKSNTRPRGRGNKDGNARSTSGGRSSNNGNSNRQGKQSPANQGNTSNAQSGAPSNNRNRKATATGRQNQTSSNSKKSNTSKNRAKNNGQENKRTDNHVQQNDRSGSNITRTSSSNTGNNSSRSRKSRTKKVQYPPHSTHAACLQRYTNNDATIIRGKLRVMPSKNGASFVTCDRGSLLKDVLIKDEKDRNRGLDGDYVFVELYPSLLEEKGVGEEKKLEGKDVTIADYMGNLELGNNNGAAAASNNSEKKCIDRGVSELTTDDGAEEEDKEVEYEEEEYLIEEGDNAQQQDDGSEYHEGIDDETEEVEMWHDDEMQMSLWNPAVNLRRKSSKTTSIKSNDKPSMGAMQRSGKVIFIIPPKSAGQQPSELTPEDESKNKKQIPKRTIVGTLTQLPNQGGGGSGGRYLLIPNNKSLPRFMCPLGTKEEGSNSDTDATSKILYRAEYAYGTWDANNRWPPCSSVTRLCGTCNIQDETKALLVENGVDHGEFPPAVLHDVEQSVKSGRFYNNGDMGWKPTEEMCKGRRDYRNHRVFTIDPTTAKDLDDALHITPLPDGRVEIGVHIADVSHFIQPNTAVDEEALKRATTVYLVNGIVPMLPRPLCEIACSLNENVERLTFSCVWRMNMDGTLSKKKGKKGEKPTKDDIWYGRTVIKSCARLDYATAQNIIDGKVANGERLPDEAYWPKSRLPTGGHTIAEVASDVRLMHKVAMARRKLRFANGALALNGIKLAFQLEEDGETPKLCAPYPIRDSNRLIEEFMLLANYLVAQRLITHAGGRALLRNHSPPLEQGMQQVVDVSKESFNFDIDTTNSNTLQESLSRLSRECDDELVVQCVTESLMTPMRPAEYMAAGELDEVDWQHFALNIPYYTHFTSPIRRYPDVIVHRLLQATLDDEVDDYPLKQKEIHTAAGHCNDMRMSAKKAQERSDRVFLSLYLKKNPLSSVLGVCLGVGEKTFTVFVPSLGLSTRAFCQEHEEDFNINAFEDSNGKRRIVISPKTKTVPGMQSSAGDSSEHSWKSLDIQVFTKLEVACSCKMQPPIDVRVKVVGPWTE